MTEKDYELFHELVEQIAIPTNFRVLARIDGLRFVIKSKEKGHSTPHIHIEAPNVNLSISIEDEPKVIDISGDFLTQYKVEFAKNWVKENLETLKKNWNELTDGVKIPL